MLDFQKKSRTIISIFQSSLWNIIFLVIFFGIVIDYQTVSLQIYNFEAQLKNSFFLFPLTTTLFLLQA